MNSVGFTLPCPENGRWELIHGISYNMSPALPRQHQQISRAPDFIIELMSKSTAAKDMNEKLFLYEEYKVKEYWIIDPWDNILTIN